MLRLLTGQESSYRLLLRHATDPHQAASHRSNAVHFLPPLDNLLWRRDRVADLFDFSYRWEIYTPAAKRRFGYYTMPILAGDALIGRIDPKLDRKRARLDIQLLQIEPRVRWTKSLRRRVLAALAAFARAHGAELGEVVHTMPEGLWEDDVDVEQRNFYRRHCRGLR